MVSPRSGEPRAQGELPLSWVLGLGGKPGSDLVSKALFVAEGDSEGTVSSCQSKGGVLSGWGCGGDADVLREACGQPGLGKKHVCSLEGFFGDPYFLQSQPQGQQ